MTTYARTRQAAKADKAARWKLIDAIQEDALSNDIPITSGESILATKEAVDQAEEDFADETVAALCRLAKFDQESTDRQRQVWRRYGWSIITRVAGAENDGLWTKDEARKFLDVVQRKTFEQVTAYIRSLRVRTHGEVIDLNDAWQKLLGYLNGYFLQGAKLEIQTDETTELDAYAQVSRRFYLSLIDKHIEAEAATVDAEWKRYSESEV
jgi:PAS domain-containing protein